MVSIVRGLARTIKTGIVQAFDSALQAIVRVRNHLAVQNQRLRERVGGLQKTIESLELENQRLRDELDASDRLTTTQYRQIMSLENEVGNLKTGWDSVAKKRLVEDLKVAKASAAAAVAERDQLQQDWKAALTKHNAARKAEQESRFAEQMAVYNAIEEQQDSLNTTINEQADKIVRLHKLIRQQQDEISRLQVEAGRERQEKESVQQALLRFVPDNATGDPLPSPDTESPQQLPSPSSGQSDQDERGAPILSRANKHLPLEPIDAAGERHEDAIGRTSSDSLKPPAWQWMREEHERAVQAEAAVSSRV